MKTYVRKWSIVSVGKIYYYDVEGLIHLYPKTKTVKVLKLEDRPCANKLATVQSVETGEIFCLDVGHLQINPEILKKKYIPLRRHYQEFNPEFIIKAGRFLTLNKGNEQLLIVGKTDDRSLIRALDQNGIIHTINVYYTDLPKANRKYEYTEQREVSSNALFYRA